VARVLKDGFTQRGLDEAKKGVLSARRLSRAQDQVLSSAMARSLYLDGKFAISPKVDDAIAAATLAGVNGALRKHLLPKRFVIAFGGDFKP
jgi:zinc protease